MGSNKFIPVWYKEHIEKLKIRKIGVLVIITAVATIFLYKIQDNYKKEIENYEQYALNQKLIVENDNNDHATIDKFLNVLKISEVYKINLISLINEEDKIILKIDYKKGSEFISRLSEDYTILSIIKENIEDNYYMEVVIK